MRTESSTINPLSLMTSQIPGEEQVLDLSLQAVATGRGPSGEQFSEFTKISRISAQKVHLSLKNDVMSKSKLTLTMVIPKTRLLETPLKLVLSGRVEKSSGGGSGDEAVGLTLHLDKKFRIFPTCST